MSTRCLERSYRERERTGSEAVPEEATLTYEMQNDVTRVLDSTSNQIPPGALLLSPDELYRIETVILRLVTCNGYRESQGEFWAGQVAHEIREILGIPQHWELPHDQDEP